MHHMMVHIIGQHHLIGDIGEGGGRENMKVVIKFYKGLILRCRTHQISDQMVDYQDFLGRVHFRPSIQGGYKSNYFI